MSKFIKHINEKFQILLVSAGDAWPQKPFVQCRLREPSSYAYFDSTELTEVVRNLNMAKGLLMAEEEQYQELCEEAQKGAEIDGTLS